MENKLEKTMKGVRYERDRMIYANCPVPGMDYVVRVTDSGMVQTYVQEYK
jgi:hypothetical protein